MSDDPQRWLPARDSTGTMKAIMVVPSLVAEDGTILKYKVWGDGSRDHGGATWEWDAETLRLFFKPEAE